jgi:hypothetical protein
MRVRWQYVEGPAGRRSKRDEFIVIVDEAIGFGRGGSEDWGRRVNRGEGGAEENVDI